MKKLSAQINQISTTSNTINKIFQNLRNKIRINMHNEWKEKLLGLEPSDNGVARVEIDESKIIGNYEKTIWMFGMIDRADKNARIYCVLDDRSQENLMSYVRNNVYTVNDGLDRELSLNTRIYSDCFASYQLSVFEEEGYKLHRVNHSIWFGSGLFNTKSIEGLWSQIKRLTKDFSGLTVNMLSKLENKGINIKDYFDSWICYGLYLRNIEKLKLSSLNTKKYLSSLLKIID